ncbi:type II secretion system F family protein [Streptomyces sp. NPDC127098]|uniref:type II secretion system F family protein n=1 Tax=Streptomyces sp. NPDC127098 TaxID=3347137 RepID=UPI00366322E9
MVNLLVALAAGIGVGLWALLVWLIPSRPPLATLVATVRAASTPPAPTPVDEVAGDRRVGWAQHLGRPFAPILRAAGLPTAGMLRDLTITGQSASTVLAEKAAMAVSGLLLPVTVQALLASAGATGGWAIPTGVALGLCVAGFLLPDISLRNEAARRRAAFRHALGAYLDLVHILLAGGSGVTGALHDAAQAGDGWAFQHLERTLETAELTRTSPWDALAQLGRELHITELSELAAALSLAGTEGARIRASLAAKATALRARTSAEAEAAATAATERMALPSSLMALGFVLFIIYAAMNHVTGAL